MGGKILSLLGLGWVRLAGALALIAFVSWQQVRIASLSGWRAGVLEEIGQAVDQRSKTGALLPVKADDARAHIAALGRFRTDVIAARANARADDAENTLATEREGAAINRKAADDYLSRIAAIRAEANRLRAALAHADAGPPPAGSVRPAKGAAPDRHGNGGSAGMPGLSAAGPGADAAAETDGLSAPGGFSPTGFLCAPMTIDERQDATEQAQQLDSLIGAIEALAAADARRRKEGQ